MSYTGSLNYMEEVRKSFGEWETLERVRRIYAELRQLASGAELCAERAQLGSSEEEEAEFDAECLSNMANTLEERFAKRMKHYSIYA